MSEIDELNQKLRVFWDTRDSVLRKHQLYWYNRMCENRKRMKLPETEFDENHNYIPKSIRRDVTGIPIDKIPE